MKELIPQTWLSLLKDEINKKYFTFLEEAVEEAYTNETIYPARKNIFKALDLVPPEKVRVVILGQDPYHSPGEATGLSFAVENSRFPKPPSLLNIFKEIEQNLRCSIDKNHSSLEGWTSQGVLLLNSFFTVKKKQPGSHSGLGWDNLTDAIISTLSKTRPSCAYLLWGNFAKSKERLIEDKKHCILRAAHPSPFSAYSGFFGCKHFSKTNLYLMDNNEEPIDWTDT